MATTEETELKQKRNVVAKEENNMANDSNFAASPYPVYNLGGDDDSVQQAVLTSHSAGSIERNQDSNFDAVRTQFTHRDVVGVGKDSQVTTLETKFDLAMHLKDSDRRHAERLARIEAKIDNAQIANLTAQLSDAKADARSSGLENLLTQILKKLP